MFVLDVSGSMAFDGKLPLSRDRCRRIRRSRWATDDRFEVITFNIAATPLFGSMTPVSADRRKQASEFLGHAQGHGRHRAAAGHRDRLSLPQCRPQLNVVILSDGMTEQREQRELVRLIKQRPAGSSVFCVGVGNEVNRPLLGAVGERGRRSGGVSSRRATISSGRRRRSAAS